MHLWFILITVQRDATQSSLFINLEVHCTCFGCQLLPSSVHKTVTTACGTGHIICAATSLQRGQANLATPIIRSTQNCNYSLRYRCCADTSLQRGQATLVNPIICSTQNCNYSLRYWSYYLYSYLLPKWPSCFATLEGGSCTVPEAVVTVLRTPDDGCGWHTKHVQWTCRIINRLLCVASRWTVTNIDQRCTEPWT